MKTTGLTLFLCVAIFAGSAAAAPFTQGNLVVATHGDGVTTLSGVGTQVTLREYTTGGASVGNDIDLSASGIVNSGSATSNGGLNLSLNGEFLTYAGYQAALGTPSVTSAVGINRALVRIDAAGVADTTTLLTDTTTYSGNNFRAAASENGTSFYTAGTGTATTNGVRYASALGTTTTDRVSGAVNTNTRHVEIYQGNDVGATPILFYSSQATINALNTSGTALPTGVDSGTLVNIAVVADAYGFVFFDRSAAFGDASLGGLDTLYIAQDETTGSLLKFEFNGVWTQVGSIDIGTTIIGETGAYGLTGELDINGNAVLYGTTLPSNDNHLFSVTDTTAFGAGGISGGFVSLGTAGANFFFRGVDFTPGGEPIPEPGTVALLGLALTGGIVAFRRRRAAA